MRPGDVKYLPLIVIKPFLYAGVHNVRRCPGMYQNMTSMDNDGGSRLACLMSAPDIADGDASLVEFQRD